MNKSYINQGKEVLIINDKGQTRQEKNNSNIEAILRLENYRSLVQRELEIEKSGKNLLSKEQKISTGVLCASAATYLGLNLFIQERLKNIDLNLMSIAIELQMAVNLLGIPLVWKFEINKNIKKNDSLIKKLELFNFATDKALKINKDKSKEITKDGNNIHYLKDSSLNIVKYYYDNHDYLKEQYCLNKIVNDSNYDDLDNSLFSFMMEKEIESESQIKAKNLTKLSYKNKF